MAGLVANLRLIDWLTGLLAEHPPPPKKKKAQTDGDKLIFQSEWEVQRMEEKQMAWKKVKLEVGCLRRTIFSGKEPTFLVEEEE